MPTYQNIKTYESGFYNNRVVDGKNTNEYNAEQISEAYIGLFTNGVKPNINGTLSDDLQVLWTSGLTIRVASGRGIFGYKYFKNKSAYSITLDESTSTTRYDLVVVRSDKSDLVGDTTIYIKSLNHRPTIRDLEGYDDEESDVHEYGLAYVTIPAQATAISQANITDMRITDMCGLVTGAYEQLDGTAIAAQWEATFNEWFEDVKETFVAGASLVRSYFNTYLSQSVNQTRIPIGISQYNRNLDVLIVMIEGRVISQSGGYTILDNSYIELDMPLPVVGTRVQFQVLKSVDGSHAETVVSEVATLRNDVDEINRKIVHHYYCNGATDNVNLSVLCRDFLTEAEDYGSMRIVVHGTFGLTRAYGGDGTTSNAYRWFDLGRGGTTNRRVFVDFSDCTPITINCASGTANIVFYGLNVNVIGANVIATGGDYIYMFSTASNTVISAENCRFWITTDLFAYISKSGTYRNCRCSVTVQNGNAYCFSVESGSLLRLFGGEYYAYTGTSTGVSAVVSVASTQTSAVAMTYGINCPTSSRGSLRQSHAINCGTNNALCSFTDTITTLTINAPGQNIRGTIAINKAGMM